MRRRSSPSLVVSIIALVFAAAGTSIAAVNFAKNAGAVDGKSATGSASSTHSAAGKLVATNSSGKVPARFLDLSGVVHGGAGHFDQTIAVTDNGNAAPVLLAGPPFGTLTATCGDQQAGAGVENAKATFAFANTSGQIVNIARSINNGAPTIIALANGAQDTWASNGESTFRYHLESNGINYVVEGVFRDDGSGTASASCLIYGYVLAITS
jgi:hypothetical protein